jgi:hypothetical protein
VVTKRSRLLAPIRGHPGVALETLRGRRARELARRPPCRHSRLPSRGTPKSDSYEGDGYVIVRDPDTDVVKAAMKHVIESIRIDYA